MGGPYHILGRIGSGGMAEVFLGKIVGAAGFEKTVAIKSILPSFTADPELTAMLIHEAKISTWLNHANLVQVLDLGQVGDRYFIVMEYVDGADLDSIVRYARSQGRRLPPALACRICREVLCGLAFVHERKDEAGQPLNLVHRDVNPPNVLVSRAGEVKLGDFGIAMARDRARLTAAGVVRGKAGYMSPEQASAGNLDARSDLFSLGVVLHELLTNHELFAGKGFLDILGKVRNAEVQPPSVVDPSVPSALDGVVLHALARRPEDRFPDARAFDAALDLAMDQAALKASATDLIHWLKDAIPQKTPQPVPEAQSLVDLGVPTGQAPQGTRIMPPLVPSIPRTMQARTFQPRKILPFAVLGLLLGIAAVFFILFSGTGQQPANPVPPPPVAGPLPPHLDGGSDAGSGASIATLDAGIVAEGPAPAPADPVREAMRQPAIRSQGTLLLNSEPWAQIAVDGKDTGFTTPTVAGLKLSVGWHRVTLHNPALELTATIEVEIQKDQLVKRFVDLRREGVQH